VRDGEHGESKFCRECATALPQAGELAVFVTRTLETMPKEVARGTIFAGGYEIIKSRQPWEWAGFDRPVEGSR
jgi:hypothetical protein